MAAARRSLVGPRPPIATLTDRGITLAQELAAEGAQMAQILFDDASEADRAAFVRTVDHIIAALAHSEAASDV